MEKVMKGPVSALSGFALDCGVARAMGYVLAAFDLGWRVLSPQPSGYQFAVGFIPRDEAALRQSLLLPWSPSRNWAHGGPIIEKENIGIAPTITFGYPGAPYHARIYNPREGKDVAQTGNTQLEAAMRCFVTSKFGLEIMDEGF